MAMWQPPERIKHEARGRALAEPRQRRHGRGCSARSRSGRLAAAHTARGCRRWCRGARPRTASSPRTCSTGTRASPRAARRDSSSRRPASATSRAARCCASATIASCPGCGSWSSVGARRRAAARRGCSSSSSTSSPSAAGRTRRSTSRASSRSRDAHRARARRCAGAADGRRARAAGRAGRRASSRECSRRASSKRCAFGYRERVTDTGPAAHPRPAAGAARAVRRRRAARPARPASTASSCTTRTPTRWRRSCRRTTRATTATAARASSACGCRSRCSPRSAHGVGADFAVGCRLLGDECIDGGSTVERRGVLRRRVRARGHRFPVALAGGKFEDAKQPKVGQAAYPYTGRAATSACRPYYSDARGPFGRNLDAAGADPARRARRRASTRRGVPPAASTTSSRPRRAARRATPTSSRRAPVARRSGLVPARCGSGAASEVRRCKFTNYCEALDQQHKQVTCKLWDRMELDAPA